jgi:hypothetical protein
LALTTHTGAGTVVVGATDEVDAWATVDGSASASAPDAPELHDDSAITAVAATAVRRCVREGRVSGGRIGVGE